MSTLEGILVVALEQAVAAPLATSRLADAGARVIKLERYEGDFARGYDDFVHGHSSYFVWLNRGKESCRVDLKRQEDLAIVSEMIAKADVFVQNLAPGAAQRLGLGARDLLDRHPGLIVCDIAGYPSGSSQANRKAYDLLVQAEAGLSHVTGTKEAGASRVGVSICDITTGQAAYAAILEALIRKRDSGRGCHLQLSLFDTIVEFMNVPYLTYRYGGHEPRRMGLSHPSIAPYGVFQLTDGEVIIAVQSEREWQQLCCDVLMDPGLARDPRFDGNINRVKNRGACDDTVQAVLKELSRVQVQELLDRAKIAYGFVSSLADLESHPARSLVPVDLPSGVNAEILAPPALVDGRRIASQAVPRLGEHDEAIRAEFGAASTAARRVS